MAYFILLIGILVLDRVVKFAVSSGMSPGQSIPVIENIFHITYIRNTGAAFSMLQGHSLILIGFPLAVMCVGLVLLVIKRKTWHPVLNTAVAMICAGGIGNLIDRLLSGYVVDMFDFRVFPVFNVADIFVCVGCGLVILYVLVIDGKKDRNDR